MVIMEIVLEGVTCIAASEWVQLFIAVNTETRVGFHKKKWESLCIKQLTIIFKDSIILLGLLEMCFDYNVTEISSRRIVLYCSLDMPWNVPVNIKTEKIVQNAGFRDVDNSGD